TALAPRATGLRRAGGYAHCRGQRHALPVQPAASPRRGQSTDGAALAPHGGYGVLMNQNPLTPTRQPVALVCGEPRLRRILRLALESGGYRVLDYADRTTPLAGAEPVAAVVDVDSLGRCPGAASRLGARGAPDRLPALFISIYP